MITFNELLDNNESMQKFARKFYEGVDEFCKDKGAELHSYYVEFDEIRVSTHSGGNARLTGMCCDGEVYFFEGNLNRSFYPEDIDSNDLMDVLISLDDTGRKFEFD